MGREGEGGAERCREGGRLLTGGLRKSAGQTRAGARAKNEFGPRELPQMWGFSGCSRRT